MHVHTYTHTWLRRERYKHGREIDLYIYIRKGLWISAVKVGGILHCRQKKKEFHKRYKVITDYYYRHLTQKSQELLDLCKTDAPLYLFYCRFIATYRMMVHLVHFHMIFCRICSRTMFRFLEKWQYKQTSTVFDYPIAI